MSQGTLYYDSKQFTPHIEKISYQDPVIQNSWGEKTLHRISLTIRSHALKGKICYSIK